MGLYFDYSKNRITSETVRLLVELAEQSGLRQHIDAMFEGDKINVTEQRAVLHVALRTMHDQSMMVDGVDVVPEVHAVLDKMPHLRITSAAAFGRGIPASASEMWSTLGSAALTSGP